MQDMRGRRFSGCRHQPFALPRDVSDALPLDRERFAVALLTGLDGMESALTPA